MLDLMFQFYPKLASKVIYTAHYVSLLLLVIAIHMQSLPPYEEPLKVKQNEGKAYEQFSTIVNVVCRVSASNKQNLLLRNSVLDVSYHNSASFVLVPGANEI